MIAFPFKLVRDNIPNRITAAGGFCLQKQLSGEAYRRALADTVVLEAQALRACSKHEELAEQLADLTEAMDAFRVANAIRIQDVETLRRSKASILGGLGRGIKILFAFGRLGGKL